MANSLPMTLRFYRGLSSAVVPLAADMLLLVPHLAAVYFCARRQPFWCGVAAGTGFLCNTKALFLLAACAVLLWPSVPLLLAGFIALWNRPSAGA